MSRADVDVGPPTDRPSPTLARPPQRSTRHRYLTGCLVVLVYLLGGVLVTVRLWVDPHHRVVAANPAGQSLSDWMLAHGAWFLTHGGNPLFTHRLNVPDGVNLMANPSTLGLTLPLSPLTLALGPDYAFAALLVLAFAATATAWYLVLARTLLPNRWAAFVAGGLCGFAPGLVAHAAGQPGLVAQFLLPLLAWRAAKLAEPGRWLRNGLLLVPLVVWQVFIDEELLLFAVVAGVVFVALLAAFRPAAARRCARSVAAGLLVAGAVSALLLAYPLWFQFFGPQAHRGLPFDPTRYGTDPATYFTFARESLSGSSKVSTRFVRTPTEENSFLGFPLLLFAGILAAWLWRSVVVRAAVLTSAVIAVLALAAHPTLHGVSLGVPGPAALFTHIPVLGLATPTRFSLLVVPLVAVVLGLGLQHAGQLSPAAGPVRRSWLLLWVATCAAALLPIAPTPLTARDRDPVPAFFTTGQWRRYLPAGRTVVAAPAASASTPDPMWWAATTRLGTPIPRGYFLGPAGSGEHGTIFGAPPRPTSTLLATVRRTGLAAPIGERDREAARADLAFWRAGLVVLAPGPAEEALWQTVSQLLGTSPIFVGGVWLWTVQP